MTNPPRKSLLRRSLTVALVFQSAWVVAAIIAVLLDIPVALLLLAGLLVLAWAPALLELIIKAPLPLSLHIHFLVFISLSSVAGSAFGVYGPIEHWDTFVHVYSAVLLASLGLFAIQSVEARLNVTLPRWFVLFAVFLTPLAFGAVWEISEYLSDYFLGTSTQWGLEDTIVDLIAALVGAAVAVVVLATIRRR